MSIYRVFDEPILINCVILEEKNDKCQDVMQILETIEAETLAAFQQYYPLTNQLGINRNDVMKIILNRYVH